MTGSGANVNVAGDDEEMQPFVAIEGLFKGRHFDRQIIVWCVSWYTSFKLSPRDLVIMIPRRNPLGASGAFQSPWLEAIAHPHRSEVC